MKWYLASAAAISAVCGSTARYYVGPWVVLILALPFAVVVSTATVAVGERLGRYRHARRNGHTRVESLDFARHWARWL